MAIETAVEILRQGFALQQPKKASLLKKMPLGKAETEKKSSFCD